jgi:TPR repeat protein
MSNLPHITQLKKLAEYALRTDGNAMFTLRMKYYNGEDFIQGKYAAFQWMKKSEKAGLQKAEMKVAKMYKNGSEVVEQDYHESSI